MDLSIRFQFLKRYTAKVVAQRAEESEIVDCIGREGSVVILSSSSLDDLEFFMRTLKVAGVIDSILCMEHLRLIDHARTDLGVSR